MKALVYYGPGKRSWEDVPDHEVRDPEDAVVRVDGFSICGTALHLLRGGVLGHLIDGGLAEAVRIPFADMSVHVLPEGIGDEEALMFADIMPTSYEVGVLNGAVRPGDTVVIVGAGPTGRAAVQTARLFSPLHILVVDPVESRRAAALSSGADRALAPDDDVVAAVHEMTGG